MNAGISDLVHDLALVALDETGMPGLAGVSSIGGRTVVRDAGELPEGRYEFHFLGDERAASAFRAGILLSGSNTVEALPSDPAVASCVLVRFVAESRSDDLSLPEALPLVRHADATSSIVSTRWDRMQSLLHSVAPSPSASIKPIQIMDRTADRMKIRIRYGRWIDRETGRNTLGGEEMYATIVGDGDRHRVEIPLDVEWQRAIGPERGALAEELSELARRHGGRFDGTSIVFPQPPSMLPFLRGLLPFRRELAQIADRARVLTARCELRADPAGRRVLSQMEKGAVLRVGNHCFVEKPDGSSTRIPATLADRLRYAEFVRPREERDPVHVLLRPGERMPDPPPPEPIDFAF